MADDAMMATLMGALNETPTPVPVEPTPVTLEPTPSTEVVIRDTQEPQPVETAAEGVTVTEEPAGLDLDEFAEAETPEQLFKGITDPNTPRLQQAWDAYKFTRQLSKPPEEGGIGHEPTVEDIRQYHDDHVTVTEMITDFETNPAKFMQGMTRVNPGAMLQVITELPNIIDGLASEVPQVAQAYQKLSERIADDIVESLLDKAKLTNANPGAKKFYFGLAKHLKYYVSDGAVELDEKSALAATPVDPFAQERAQLKREREEIENARRAETNGKWQSFVSTAVAEVEAEVVKGFAWPEELKTKHGSLLNTLNKDALLRVKQSVGKIPIAKQELDAIMSKTKVNLGRVDSNQAKTEFTRTFLKYARPIIVKVKQDILKEAGITLRPKAVPGTPVAVPAKAATVAPVVEAPMVRKPGQSFDDFANQVLMGKLQ